jgi:hypothetical protein
LHVQMWDQTAHYALCDGSPEPSRLSESLSTVARPGRRTLSEQPPVVGSIGSVWNRESVNADGQGYDEASPAVRGKVGSDLPAMQLDDLPADIESQS